MNTHTMAGEHHIDLRALHPDSAFPYTMASGPPQQQQQLPSLQWVLHTILSGRHVADDPSFQERNMMCSMMPTTSMSPRNAMMMPQQGSMHPRQVKNHRHTTSSSFAEGRSNTSPNNYSGSFINSQAKKNIRRCRAGNCTKMIKAKGFCWAHGGKQYCKHETCNKGTEF